MFATGEVIGPAHPVIDALVREAGLSRGAFQSRRKRAIAALAELDPVAGELARRWATQPGRDELATVEGLARHVRRVDTFFEWTSDRDPVDAA